MTNLYIIIWYLLNSLILFLFIWRANSKINFIYINSVGCWWVWSLFILVKWRFFTHLRSTNIIIIHFKWMYLDWRLLIIFFFFMFTLTTVTTIIHILRWVTNIYFLFKTRTKWSTNLSTFIYYLPIWISQHSMKLFIIIILWRNGWW